MNEKEIQQNDLVEIDLGKVLSAITSRAWLVAAASIAGAVLAFLITVFLITPKYQSSAMFYVNNGSLSVGDASLSLSSGDLSTSRNLVESYIVILKTRASLNEVIDYTDSTRSYESLKEMITASAVSETEIFEVKVTSEDPQEAERIANAIAYILPKRISSIIEGTSAKVVDAAVVPSSPSSPDYMGNTLIGLLAGFALAVGVITMREVFDITIRGEEDMAQSCEHPVLAAVPDMVAPSKGSTYYYGYGSIRSKKKSSSPAAGKQPELIGGGMGFAASEAYKLLRTKLQFSFADDNDCRVIGVSSALSGEGKSVTAVNLAYSLSQLDKKVILIDCDMRRPTVAAKLGIHKAPGLSNYLTGQSAFVDIVQPCGLPGEENAFRVVAAGQNPPNPIELLSSARMQGALKAMRKVYDYVILDLPPVGEVSDAMAVAKDTDGMLLVVRQNYCDRIALGNAARQFKFVNSRVLGIVFNCTSENNGKGYGQRYYKKYYRRYYGKSGGSYEGSYAAPGKRK